MSHPLPITALPGAMPQNQSAAARKVFPLVTDWLGDFVYNNRILFFVGVVVSYFVAFNGKWRMEPDAGLYLTLGRNLAEGRGYIYLWQPHHLAYPGLPWLLAGLFKIFGSNAIWPADLMMLLISLATLTLVYRLFLLHGGSKLAVIVTLGVAVTKTFFRYAYEIRSDMPFLLGVMAFLCGYESITARHAMDDGQSPRVRKWYDWALLISGLGLAAIMRPTIWVLLLAIVCCTFLSVIRGRVRWQAVVISMVLFGIVGFSLYALSPRHFASNTDDYEAFAYRAVTTSLPKTINQIVNVNVHDLFYLATPDSIMQVRFGPINVVLSIVFIGMGLALWRVHSLWGVFFAGVVLMNLCFLALDRYFLPVIPLMTFAWWTLLCKLEKRLDGSLPRWAASAVVLSLFGIGMASNLDKIGGIILEQHWQPFLTKYNRGTYEALPALAKTIQDNTDENSLIIFKGGYGRITTYLSHRNVADFRDFALIHFNGHSVFLVEPTQPEALALLSQHKLQPGELIATVNNSKGEKAYTLRKVVPE